MTSDEPSIKDWISCTSRDAPHWRQKATVRVTQKEDKGKNWSRLFAGMEWPQGWAWLEVQCFSTGIVSVPGHLHKELLPARLMLLRTSPYAWTTLPLSFYPTICVSKDQPRVPFLHEIAPQSSGVARMSRLREHSVGTFTGVTMPLPLKSSQVHAIWASNWLECVLCSKWLNCLHPSLVVLSYSFCLCFWGAWCYGFSFLPPLFHLILVQGGRSQTLMSKGF